MTIPLVSVLICTRNRRDRVRRVIRNYVAQDYPNKELVLVDDGDDLVSDLLENLPDATYLYRPSKNLSEKRNHGIEAATGEYICHFDDDDWHGPNRLSDQVRMIEDSHADIVGYSHCYWWDEVRNVASHYMGPMWGATMLYRTEFALDHPWDESISLAEDAPFTRNAVLHEKPAGENMVAVMHAGNWQRQYSTNFWPIVPFEKLPIRFREELENR